MNLISRTDSELFEGKSGFEAYQKFTMEDLGNRIVDHLCDDFLYKTHRK